MLASRPAPALWLALGGPTRRLAPSMASKAKSKKKTPTPEAPLAHNDSLPPYIKELKQGGCSLALHVKPNAKVCVFGGRVLVGHPWAFYAQRWILLIRKQTARCRKMVSIPEVLTQAVNDLSSSSHKRMLSGISDYQLGWATESGYSRAASGRRSQ